MKNIFNHFIMICNELLRISQQEFKCLSHTVSSQLLMDDLSDASSFLLTSPSSAMWSTFHGFQQAVSRAQLWSHKLEPQLEPKPLFLFCTIPNTKSKFYISGKRTGFPCKYNRLHSYIPFSTSKGLQTTAKRYSRPVTTSDCQCCAL